MIKKLMIKLAFLLYGISAIPMVRNVCRLVIVRLDGGWYWSKAIRRLYKTYHGITVGYGTYGGAFDLEKIPPGTAFGRYCSIAKNVWVFNGNHPKEYFSTHPLFYNPALGYVKADRIKRNSLSVGHDVWIGANTIILPAVNQIGNGAIVGAGSVVTKNVAPYHIVAGNPARVIGVRFADEKLNKLELQRWWQYDRSKLIAEKQNLEEILQN
ncbi:hypothetical protein P22_0540 [Propionispora sp. 2/2-37]|uniref:CatB-related O-acetyltransferase n=1 Tax=Propionispora sp. 2/2-37 TaxID=1677858 RepID=UPI0006BB9336|nr:CatB-related O-acetyltransferase [Propionispora sp. 2/2-37]CUH94474.1 hypothetical protein P22_0540 [Propionispora sp. 2/2-37]